MYKRIFIYAAVAALFAGSLTGNAVMQERAPVPGLEADSVYTSLLAQEEELSRQEDSLNARVADIRGLFRTDPDNRERYSEEIIRLEGELFNTRNLIGIVAGKINTIEQEYIIKNLSGGNDPRQGGGRSDRSGGYAERSANLVLNPFFEENLQPEDYRMLVEAQGMEAGVLDHIHTFASNYESIRRIAHENETVDTPEAADSLYSAYETLTGLNDRLSVRVDEEFGYVYDNKLYCYNYILDKLGRRNQLTLFEQKITETREQCLTAGEGAQSEPVAAYPYRKALLGEYEETLARIAGYDRALDSLHKARTAMTAMNFDFPAVGMDEKLFLDYADIEFHNPEKYNQRNPVPELTIYPKGEIYRILLGSFQRAQPVSILRGAYPVGVARENGNYAYYAGGFRSLEEAADAVSELKKKGFRDPKVARWDNGRLTVLSQAEVDRALGTVRDGLFRISVDTGGRPLPDIVREIAEEINPGAEISRSGDLYIIGTFDSRDDAEELAEEIEDILSGAEVKIEAVG
ncbi:MAG: hypothetical protein LIO85_08445 [Rikenellaceae bacterium]|nr:hypothetical protein [Rikenellaceae bacterium]